MWLLPRSSSCALASACSAKALPPGSGTSEELPALWVTSSGTPMLRLFSWRGWQARRWSQRLYGPGTLRMSDGSAGLAQWIASWRDSLASRTPWPADAKEPTTPDGFGRQSPSAFAWFDPESSCWKTSPGCDLLGECLPYSQTWPRSGSVSNGTACERPTWARPISGSGFSSWPTSRSTDGSKGGPNQRGSSGDLMLPSAAANWATPRANDSETRGTVAERSAQELVSMAQNWPTPASRDQKGENSMAHMIRADGRTDGRTGKNHADQLPNFVMLHFSLRDPMMTDGQKSSQQDQTSRRRLNPQFVDWLMGWPPGWTSTEPAACDAAAMGSFRCKLDSHLSCLLGEPGLHRAA